MRLAYEGVASLHERFKLLWQMLSLDALARPAKHINRYKQLFLIQSPSMKLHYPQCSDPCDGKIWANAKANANALVDTDTNGDDDDDGNGNVGILNDLRCFLSRLRYAHEVRTANITVCDKQFATKFQLHNFGGTQFANKLGATKNFLRRTILFSCSCERRVRLAKAPYSRPEMVVGRASVVCYN